MTLKIRKLQTGDRAAWELLWREYQAFYGVDLSRDVTDTLWLRLHDPAEPVVGFAAEAHGGLIGLVHCVLHRSTWLIADTCYMQDLFVGEAHRGQGVAAKLIEAVYTLADKRGAAQVYWITHASNSAARRLYDRVASHGGFIAYERFAEPPRS
jgi:GNAT superfamily N-acetyltransferase